MLDDRARVAFDLVPLMEYLHDGGIYTVQGPERRVHVSPKFFHQAFPEVKVPEDTGWGDFPFRWTTTVERDGRKVVFFALDDSWEADE